MARLGIPRLLMYHGICDVSPDPNGACTSLERFEAQMRYLKLRNLRGVSIRELRRAVDSRAADGLVGLTFDDGYENFLQSAVPVLERFGFSATVFVVSGMLGGENDWHHDFTPKPNLKLLSANGVREVSERGMEVGSHTMSHADLRSLEPALLWEEVNTSRRTLEELLGSEVEGFCYPFGSLDNATVQAVRASGYEYACAVTKQDKWDNYTLPRIPLSDKDGVVRFATKLSIYWLYSGVKTRLVERFRK